jgi:hypothetical protein
MAFSAGASGDLPEFTVDTTPSKFMDARSVRDSIDEFLSAKGYSEGRNTRSKGGDIFIAVGTGVIQAPRNSPGYMNSRINAFDKALLNAKKQMAEYISIEIQNEIISDYAEGQSPAIHKKRSVDSASALEEPGIIQKTKALVNVKLDQMLEAQGVDLTKPVPQEEIKKVLTSEDFEKTVKSASKARIVGLQAWKVFEVSPDGRKGQIGVVAVYSEKLHRMADALFSGNFSSLPEGTPKKPIIKQIPEDVKVLLTTFGVQQKIDENGRLVLVAFGQGVPKTESTRSVDAAFEKAKLDAMSNLRSFAGEIVMVEGEVHKYESVQELEDGMEQYENEEFFRDRVQSQAQSLRMSGIRNVRRWQSVHPLTNKPVVGVVIAWSPQSATQAGQMAEKMTSKPVTKSSSSNSVVQSGSGQSGSYSGAGAAADEDSF